MPEALPMSGGGRSLLRVVSNTQLPTQEQADLQRAQDMQQEPELDELASHIRNKITMFRRHRTSQQIDEQLLAALRAYRGKYSSEKLAEIKKFQGSDVYARVTAVKCRGTSALLRDVYLRAERPWDLDATPEPAVPEDINQSIQQLVSVEIATLQQAGQQIDPQMIKDRVNLLKEAAKRAAARQADRDATRASESLDDLLVEGGFYEALAEFLNDLPIFPSCRKFDSFQVYSIPNSKNKNPPKRKKNGIR